MYLQFAKRNKLPHYRAEFFAVKDTHKSVRFVLAVSDNLHTEFTRQSNCRSVHCFKIVGKHLVVGQSVVLFRAGVYTRITVVNSVNGFGTKYCLRAALARAKHNTVSVEK